jgi:hypothetical protein
LLVEPGELLTTLSNGLLEIPGHHHSFLRPHALEQESKGIDKLALESKRVPQVHLLLVHLLIDEVLVDVLDIGDHL